MSRLSELRQHGAFPGALVNVLDEIEQRLAALEAHKPMLDELKPQYKREKTRQSEHEAQIAAQAGPGDPNAANAAAQQPAPGPGGKK